MSEKDPTLAEVRAELKGDIADVARTVSKIAKDQTKIIDLIVSVRFEATPFRRGMAYLRRKDAHDDGKPRANAGG